jgi:hypothetical protein
VYCHNDPINYTDPSGQFVAAYLTSVAVSTVVGGVVGAITGGIAYAVANPCEDVWQSSGFWKAVGIGFVSGMAGGFVGGVVGGGLGMLGWAVVSPYLASVGLVGWIAAGVGIGAVSGAAGGAAGGAASQLVWNALWGRPLWDNVGRAALTGAIIGGVLGGILGGIHGARAYGQYQAALAAGAAEPKLLAPPKMHNHHIFPQRFREWFAARGINIDQYTVTLSRGTHLGGVHGRGGYVGPGNTTLPGQWNSLWDDFIRANQGATAKEIYQFAGQLMDDFGLSGLPIVPYR